MIKTSHRTLYAISGAIWLGVGIMLLNLGLGFIMQGFQGHSFITSGYSSLFTSLASTTGGFELAAIIVIAVSLLVGGIKGRLVMQKAAQKSFNRISQLANPTPITNIYTRSNIAILAVMMSLGMLMKVVGLPLDIRGAIDTAVGCALMQGSLAYFRFMTSCSAKT